MRSQPHGARQHLWRMRQGVAIREKLSQKDVHIRSVPSVEALFYLGVNCEVASLEEITAASISNCRYQPMILKSDGMPNKLEIFI